MANKYEAHTDGGEIYTVTTTKHHSEHTDSEFKQILASIIQGTASGAASAGTQIIVARYFHKKL